MGSPVMRRIAYITQPHSLLTLSLGTSPSGARNEVSVFRMLLSHTPCSGLGIASRCQYAIPETFDRRCLPADEPSGESRRRFSGTGSHSPHLPSVGQSGRGYSAYSVTSGNPPCPFSVSTDRHQGRNTHLPASHICHPEGLGRSAVCRSAIPDWVGRPAMSTVRANLLRFANGINELASYAGIMRGSHGEHRSASIRQAHEKIDS